MRKEKSKSGKVENESRHSMIEKMLRRKGMRNKALFIGIVAIALAVAIGASANIISHTEASDKVNVPDVPHKINYQGYLTDAAGNPITGYLDMTFGIYDSLTGGTPLWSETQTSVHVENGLFNVILGSVNTIPGDVFPIDGSRWLETEIEGQPLTPRKEIVSVAYAFKADQDNDWCGACTGEMYTCCLDDNVGIGTASPGAKLDVVNSLGDSWIRVGSGVPNSIGGIKMRNDARTWIIDTSNDDKFKITDSTAGMHRLTIDTAGNVGIGTDDPQAKLHIMDGNARIGEWLGEEFRLSVYGEDQTAIVGASNPVSSNEATGVMGFGSDVPSLTPGYRILGVRGRAANWWSTAPGDFYGGYFDISHFPMIVPSPGANYFGVYASARGDLNRPQTCYGIYAEASGGANNYAGYFNGNLAVVNGLKSVAVKIDEEYRMLSCLESPEVWFEDFGSGRLVNGRAHIDLDPLFLKAVTVNADNPIKVFVQLNGECNGVYVEKGIDGFDVIELDNGTTNVSFDYRVVAKRKGYENYRFEKMGGLTPEEMEAKQAVYREKTEKELKDLLQYQGREIEEVK